MVLHKSQHLPLYVQVREQLRGRIVTGALAPGTRLPPVRQLAETLGVNQNTVLKAMQELQSEGYIQMRQGRGAFVLPQPERFYPEQKQAEFDRMVEGFVTRALALGISSQDMVAAVISRSFEERETAPALRGVFVECNRPTAQRYAADLEHHLGVPFTPVLLEELEEDFEEYQSLLAGADLVVTTVVHRPEVEALLVEHLERPRNLYALAMGQILDVAFRLSQLPSRTPVGLICMSAEDVRVMERSLKKALPQAARELKKSPMTDAASVRQVLGSVEVLVLTTVVRERLGDQIPPGLTLIEYRNQLDEAGIEMLRQVTDNLRHAKRASAR
ncbi:MAG: GntR family transcriptional regulator [Bacillota bacterium]